VTPKRELDDVRRRSLRLRDHSRELSARSRDCRRRLREAVAAIEDRVTRPAGAAGAADIERLLRAESDLESAIAECTAALGAVRRELGWRDDAQATVH
jgi:hypothetical protein